MFVCNGWRRINVPCRYKGECEERDGLRSCPVCGHTPAATLPAVAETESMGNSSFFVDKNDAHTIALKTFAALGHSTSICGQVDLQTNRICVAFQTMDRRFNGTVMCSQCGVIRDNALSNMDFKFDSGKTKLICESFRNRPLVEREFYGDRIFSVHSPSLLQKSHSTSSSTSLSSVGSSPMTSADSNASSASLSTSVPTSTAKPLIPRKRNSSSSLPSTPQKPKKAKPHSPPKRASKKKEKKTHKKKHQVKSLVPKSNAASSVPVNHPETSESSLSSVYIRHSLPTPSDPRPLQVLDAMQQHQTGRPAALPTPTPVSPPTAGPSTPLPKRKAPSSPDTSGGSTLLRTSTKSKGKAATSCTSTSSPSPPLSATPKRILPKPKIRAPVSNVREPETVTPSATADSESPSVPPSVLIPEESKRPSKKAKASNPSKKKKSKKSKAKDKNTDAAGTDVSDPAARSILSRNRLSIRGQEWINQVATPPSSFQDGDPRSWITLENFSWELIRNDACKHWATYATYKVPNDKRRSFSPLECKAVLYLTCLMHGTAFLPIEFFQLHEWPYPAHEFDKAWRTVYQMIRTWWFETHASEPLFDIMTLGSRYLDRILSRFNTGYFGMIPTPEQQMALKTASHTYMDMLLNNNCYLHVKLSREAKQSKKKSHKAKKNAQASRYINRDWLLVTFLCLQWSFMYDLDFALPWTSMTQYVGLKAHLVIQDGKAFAHLFKQAKYTTVWLQADKE